MWIYLPWGFFSVVRKPGEADLCVRARVAGDLDRLRQQYLPELGETAATTHTDYPFRATVPHAALGRAMGRIVADLDYSNVKAETARVSGPERHDVYAAVHGKTRGLRSPVAPAAGATVRPKTQTDRRRRERIEWTLIGLSAGDCLGSTVEFKPRESMPAVYERLKHTGWPLVQIGGGPFGWRAGQGTDDTDMAWAIVESFLTLGEFDERDIADRFVRWMNGGAPDVGGTVRAALRLIEGGLAPDAAGLRLYRERPDAAANGSLMRNGVVAALADSLAQAFEYTVRQSVVTHYHPLPVLCCCLQTWLIWNAFGPTPAPAMAGDWPAGWQRAWTTWADECDHPTVRRWLTEVRTGDDLTRAMGQMMAAQWGSAFDPFSVPIKGRDGHCLLSLQIAVWAYAWATVGRSGVAAPPVPSQIPPVLQNGEPGTALCWTVLLGHDADTYAAIAGPMIGAQSAGVLPSGLTANLEVRAKLLSAGPRHE